MSNIIMKNSFIFLWVFLTQFSFAQTVNEYLTVDQKMTKIPDSLTTTTDGIASFINSNFKTESEKIRAVFYWTTTNISYDVPNMFEPNQLDSPEEKIAKALEINIIDLLK